MDLNSIVISQIEKSAKENEIKKEAARKEEEEADRKETEKFQIYQKEELIRFNLQKKVFEESFVREIMTVIINIINTSKTKNISPLRKRIFEIVRSHPDAIIKDNATFLLEPAYSFKNIGCYIIKLVDDCGDDFCIEILSFVVSENHQISCYSSLFNYKTKQRVTLSNDKEEAAAQIINYLMID